ncbi:MAG: hypothetical protein A2W33_04365 [Chloroflexi bacterium RBG_16_52_11]|nr:MAG: hypothetical protein A2W33_04365 [Chloroflexi bacterium RBG_16_52_11]
MSGLRMSINTDEILKKLDLLGKEVFSKENVGAAALKGTDVMQRTVQQLASFSKTIPAAIKSERSRYITQRAFVAGDIKRAPHIYLVEHGTTKMAPRGFFRVGVRISRPAARLAMKTYLAGLYGKFMRTKGGRMSTARTNIPPSFTKVGG